MLLLVILAWQDEFSLLCDAPLVLVSGTSTTLLCIVVFFVLLNFSCFVRSLEMTYADIEIISASTSLIVPNRSELTLFHLGKGSGGVTMKSTSVRSSSSKLKDVREVHSIRSHGTDSNKPRHKTRSNVTESLSWFCCDSFDSCSSLSFCWH